MNIDLIKMLEKLESETGDLEEEKKEYEEETEDLETKISDIGDDSEDLEEESIIESQESKEYGNDINYEVEEILLNSKILPVWMNEYIPNAQIRERIKIIKAEFKDIPENSFVIFTYYVDSRQNKRLVLINKANLINIPDLQPTSFKVIGDNQFSITQKINKDLYVRTYKSQSRIHYQLAVPIEDNMIIAYGPSYSYLTRRGRSSELKLLKFKNNFDKLVKSNVKLRELIKDENFDLMLKTKFPLLAKKLDKNLTAFENIKRLNARFHKIKDVKLMLSIDKLTNIIIGSFILQQ